MVLQSHCISSIAIVSVFGRNLVRFIIVQLIQFSKATVELPDCFAFVLQFALERLFAGVDFYGCAFALETEEKGACVFYVLFYEAASELVEV